MHGNIKIIALVGIMFCITPYASAQLADTSWPMFGYGLNHTGLSNHYGPDTPTVKWTFSTGDRIYTPASIGYDDTIYIGTHDKCSWTDSKLYAVYPNGTEKWHWTPPSHGIFNSFDSTPAVAYCWEGRERADRADLNNDCKVNILDAVIIGTCWGHTAWY